MNNKYVEIRNARGQAMIEKWQRIINDNIDPFDPKYIKEYIGGNIILDSDHWYAFQNDHPYPETQYQFVIPTKKFFTTFSEVPGNVSLDLDHICQKLAEKYNINGGARFQRFGDPLISGASVIHLHAQLIVPKPGKKVAAWFGSEYLE